MDSLLHKSPRRTKGTIFKILLGMSLLGVAAMIAYIALFNYSAWVSAHRLSAALKGARGVALVEYAGEIELARRIATPDEISQLRNAINVWSRPFVPKAYLCFVPHHRIEIVRADGSEVDTDICFLCDKFTIENGPSLAPLPTYLGKPLASFFTSVGMTPKTDDEYATMEIAERRRLSKKTAASPHPIFTVAVDWFNPLPESLYLEQGVEVPDQLFSPVPEPQREEATTLLMDADIIPLSKEQAARLTSIAEPAGILQTLIEERMEKLRFYQRYPLDEEDILKREGQDQLENQKRQRRDILDHLSSDIERLDQWKERLKPYLFKAVALQTGGRFGGEFILEDLLVYHNALGRNPVPMERCPVVAFLPKRPHVVYTEVGMME